MPIRNSTNAAATVDRWTLTLSACLALFIVLSTGYGVIDNYHPIPLYDHWRTIDLYQAYLDGNMNLKLLWEQNHEHRILFPKILILLDYLLAQGTGRLLLVLILMFQGLHALLLCGGLRKNEGLATVDKIFLSLTAITFSFWFIQKENFTWGFQVCFILNGLSASLAAYLACRTDPGKGRAFNWSHVVSAAVFCLVAAYSLANGIFMWAVLLAILAKTGLSRGLMAFWWLFGAILAASYLPGYYTPSGHSSLANAFQMKTVLHVLVYLGNPFSKLDIRIGAFMGLAGLLLFLFHARRLMMEKTPSFYRKFGLSVAAYVVCTAVITAVGRTNFGLFQATSNRYHTPALLFWFILVTLIYEGSLAGAISARKMRLGILCFGLLYVCPSQIVTLGQRARAAYLKNDVGTLAMMVGVRDTVTHHELFPWDSLAHEKMDFLRRHRLSVYSEPWTLTLGRRIEAAYEVDTSLAWEGELEEIRPVDSPPYSGYFIRGRVHPTGKREAPEVILFTRVDTVIGFAKTAKRPCRECFSGYVRGLDHANFNAFALDNRNKQLVKIDARF